MDIILKQELKVSPKTLRCADQSGHSILTGSLSKQVYLLTQSNGEYQVSRTFDVFDSEAYSVRFLSESTFAVGCRNGTIHIINLDGEVLRVLGQSGSTVSGLDRSGNYLASGHWDGTCIVWSLETFERVRVLEEHNYAVVCRFLPNGNLVTGSQTGELHLWHGTTFDKIRTVQAHTNIIRAIEAAGPHVITCSNDAQIKIWDENLNAVNGQTIHTSFIYDAVFYRATEQGVTIVSGGEDFRLIMSENLKEVASVPYPTSIWKIIANEKAHEILAFGDGGYLRVFTTDKSLVTNLDAHADFISAGELASFQNPDISAEELARFTPKSLMASISGRKEGEVKVFNNSGKGEVYCWKNGQWEYQGHLFGGPTKSHYDGDDHFPKGDYDYIFDIQDDSGASRLLPFSNGDDPVKATEKFIEREKISANFKDQIINFIVKNTKGSTPANHEAQDDSQQIYEIQSHLHKFPITDYIFFFAISTDEIRTQVHTLNEKLSPESSSHKKLTSDELAHFDSLLNKLTSPEGMNATSLSAEELSVVAGKLLKWTDESDIPVLDLMRMFVLHKDAGKILNSAESGAQVLSFAVNFAKHEQENSLVLIFKLFSNLFKNHPQIFFNSNPITKDFLAHNAPKFTPKVVSTYFSFVGNLTSHLLDNQLGYDMAYLIEFLSTLDLDFLLSSEQESANFVILLGNALAFGNHDISKIILQTSLKKTLDQIAVGPKGLLEDIRCYLQSE
jgi:phospholipase A-2-activating protein